MWRILAVSSILAGVGCNATVAREELVGRYRVDYGYGTEQLTLRADGTYTQEFAAKGEALRPVNRGRYVLRAGDYWDGQLLELHDPVVVDELGKRTAMTRWTDAVWPLRVRKSWTGNPRFPIDEDIGLEFDRVK